MIQAHKYLSEIKNYKPGSSNIKGFSDVDKIIKLSSNENGIGVSQNAINAYKKHAVDIFRYADGSCLSLREEIAAKNNIDANRIVCGAGSDEIISLLTSAFAGIDDEIIYSEHGFLMYPISAKKVGANPIAVKEKNLKYDIDNILNAINNKTKIIFIANPNNPTGSYLNKDELEKLIKAVPKNILIVLDCAYQEFAENIASDYPNPIPIVNENNNVVLTRTFSKIYGLASLRIGWSYSSLNIAEILNKIRGPFNVGGPAQSAAIAALRDDDFLLLSLNHNRKWLERIFDHFSYNSKIKLHPSVANFILFDFGSKENCAEFNDILLKSGIIVREMSSYNLPNCLRITIGNDLENERLLNVLK